MPKLTQEGERRLREFLREVYYAIGEEISPEDIAIQDFENLEIDPRFEDPASEERVLDKVEKLLNSK